MIVSIIVILLYIKLFLFWLWLWQLKEYHIGRFVAHFKEGQALKKILSGFWRLKYPKFTKKIVVIFLTGLSLALFIIFNGYYFAVFFLIILIPLFFQIPTVLWRKRYLEKAKKKREQYKDLIVIGITGSYGKTSTKEFLYSILAKKFGEQKVLKTKEHQNSEVGISQCILNDLKPGHEIFICEMGAYNRGGIKLLCDIAKPTIGVLTGINEQHMATFGSQENIIKAKYELIESLPADGIAFFNAKNSYCVELYNKTNIKKILYGQAARFQGEENILGAMAVAKELKMSDEEISAAIKEIGNTFPGVQIKKGADGFTVIDAAYSANPNGVIANLEYLNTFSGKKILVMPCLIELGNASAEIHRKIGAKIAQVCDLAIITTKDRFYDIQQGAGESKKVECIESPLEIVKRIKSIAQLGDVVLLEGRVPDQLKAVLLLE